MSVPMTLAHGARGRHRSSRDNGASGVGSRVAFTALLAGVAGLRIAELKLSARNAAALRARGGTEHAADQMPLMRAMHTAWFVSSLVEVWGAKPPFRPALAAAGTAGLAAGMALRRASQEALGDRWTATVMTVPDEPRVRSGIFERMRHPNYAGVVVEIAAVPLVHGAWRTSAVFSALNAAMLRARIRAEERALNEAERASQPLAPEATIPGAIAREA